MKEIKVIKKAFNDGYTLQRLNPELAVMVAKSFKSNEQPYAKGFIAGTIEYIRERGLAKEISSKYSAKKSKDRSKDRTL